MYSKQGNVPNLFHWKTAVCAECYVHEMSWSSMKAFNQLACGKYKQHMADAINKNRQTRIQSQGTYNRTRARLLQNGTGCWRLWTKMSICCKETGHWSVVDMAILVEVEGCTWVLCQQMICHGHFPVLSAQLGSGAGNALGISLTYTCLHRALWEWKQEFSERILPFPFLLGFVKKSKAALNSFLWPLMLQLPMEMRMPQPPPWTECF